MNKKTFAKIINKEECLSILNIPPATDQFKWGKLEKIKNLSGKNEWEKHNFHPSNGLVGEIEGTIINTIWNFNVYILKIHNKYYVPITLKGIDFITQDKFGKLKSYNQNKEINNNPKILKKMEEQSKILSNLNYLKEIFSFSEENLVSNSVDSNEIEHYEFERSNIRYYFFLSKYRFEYENEFYSEKNPIEYITFHNEKKTFNLLQIPAQKEHITEINLDNIKEKIHQIIENEKKLLSQQKIEIHRKKNPESDKCLSNIYHKCRYFFLKKISMDINMKLVENIQNNSKSEEIKTKMIEEFKSIVSIENFVKFYNYPFLKIKPTLEKLEVISIKEIDECILMEVEVLINSNNNLRRKIFYFFKSIDSPKFNIYKNLDLDSLFSDIEILNNTRKNNVLTKDFLDKFELEFNTHLERTYSTRLQSTLDEINSAIKDEKYKFKENREQRLKEEEKLSKTTEALDFLKNIRKG